MLRRGLAHLFLMIWYLFLLSAVAVAVWMLSIVLLSDFLVGFIVGIFKGTLPPPHWWVAPVILGIQLIIVMLLWAKMDRLRTHFGYPWKRDAPHDYSTPWVMLKNVGCIVLFLFLWVSALKGASLLVSRRIFGVVMHPLLDLWDIDPGIPCLFVATGIVVYGFYWHVKQQRLVKLLKAVFLALSYSDRTAYLRLHSRIGKFYDFFAGHQPIFRYFDTSRDTPTLGDFVRTELAQYAPDKDVVLGPMILADQVIAEYPISSDFIPKLLMSLDPVPEEERLHGSRRSQCETFDGFIRSHLADDIKTQFPEEVYHLRVHLLGEYLKELDSSDHDPKSTRRFSTISEQDAQDSNSEHYYAYRYRYDLPEALPIQQFYKHILHHIHGGVAVDFDEERLRECFVKVNAQHGIGGSWLKPWIDTRALNDDSASDDLADNDLADDAGKAATRDIDLPPPLC
ncbi:MAG: hypothetical protein FJ280_23015 [Planctomycetes bacterium]|nr:hypothetical protein [Planctomycetota bacterium]